jgi:hypothetical protein
MKARRDRAARLDQKGGLGERSRHLPRLGRILHTLLEDSGFARLHVDALNEKSRSSERFEAYAAGEAMSPGLTLSQILYFKPRAQRDKAGAHRYFEKSIDQNGEPDTVTIDRSGANLAALEAINADRETPIKIRQSKYLNNLVEQDHQARDKSCWPTGRAA